MWGGTVELAKNTCLKMRKFTNHMGCGKIFVVHLFSTAGTVHSDYPSKSIKILGTSWVTSGYQLINWEVKNAGPSRGISWD